MPERALGPYLLERKLGAGGFGAVWVGRHQASGARHALKVIEMTEAADALRFQREAEALTRLEGGPGAVRVHAAFAMGATAVIAMELVEGPGDLWAHLGRQGPLPPRAAVELVLAVARTVAHAHAQGVLHRDLKPHNVLIDPAGRPRLVDLGLAAVSGERSLTRTGEVLGTPAWAAPEQALGGRGDARTDVFGLGALLFGCLTGRAPREGGSAVALLARAASEPVPDPRVAGAPATPAGLAAIVRRATALDPAQRHPGAAALVAELEGFLAGSSPGARARGLRAAPLVAGLLVMVALAWLALRREEASPAPGQGAPPGPAPLAAPESRATVTALDPAALAATQREAQEARAADWYHELNEALRRDEQARSPDPARPTPNLARVAGKLREALGGPEVGPGPGLRQALARIAQERREALTTGLTRDGPWRGTLLLALEAYRYYWLDPSPDPAFMAWLPDRPPLDTHRGWHQLADLRAGSFRDQDSGELAQLDPDLFLHARSSRLLAHGEMLRRLARPSPDLAGLAGLAPLALGNLGSPDLASSAFRDASLCSLILDRTVEATNREGPAVGGALLPCAEACLARLRAQPEGLLEVAPHAVTLLRQVGEATGDLATCRRAVALGEEWLGATPGDRPRALRDLAAALVSQHETTPGGDGEALERALDLARQGQQVPRPSQAPWAALALASVHLARWRLQPASPPAEDVERVLDVAASGGEEELDRRSWGFYGRLRVESALRQGDLPLARERLEWLRLRAAEDPSWIRRTALAQLERELELERAGAR